MEHDHFDVDNSSVDEATKVLQPGDLVEMVFVLLAKALRRSANMCQCRQ